MPPRINHLLMSRRIKQNRKLAAEIRQLKIVQTLPISCPYRSIHHYKVVNLSKGFDVSGADK